MTSGVTRPDSRGIAFVVQNPPGKPGGSAGQQSAEQYARRQMFSLPLRRLRQGGQLLPSPYIYPSTLERGSAGGANVQRTCAGVPPLGIRKSCMR